MDRDEFLIRDLPDPEAARRFLGDLSEQRPKDRAKLSSDEGLLSDVLTLVAFSPLLASTMLQHPDYLWWLGKKRHESGVCSKEDLLESLARFSMTNSQLDLQTLYARFRRRELLRIYLRDIRGLATIAEITEELSNLADAILESALENARREVDNRFGIPFEAGDSGRAVPARFCIAALGKLGSRELNYSSDIDLLFIYSGDGETSGNGTRGRVTNREYFIKLAELTTRLAGQSSGEGSAYRVDLRLRPHGTLGPLAISEMDAVRYYRSEARPWERQVMIRSRGCAGEISLFSEFFERIEDLVFSKDETVETALSNVRKSKEQIDLGEIDRRGFNVKLGKGGIREIEFLAQALQLAFGGRDRWLRSPHTLISLSRLADRRHLSKTELTDLNAAYDFLRRTEHVLQMENGLQTHSIPDDTEKRRIVGKRIEFASGVDFEESLKVHTANVSRIFSRVFGEIGLVEDAPLRPASEMPTASDRVRSHVLASIDRSEFEFDATAKNTEVLDRLTRVSPHFAAMLAANPHLANELPDPDASDVEGDYLNDISDSVMSLDGLGPRLSAMRRVWSRFMLEIVIYDVFERITITESRRRQTRLAEASIAVAFDIVQDELRIKYGGGAVGMHLAVLALGKLGGRGLDYGSDLDLVLVYDNNQTVPAGSSAAEYYGRAVELFVTTLSSMTRDGSLYRIDLRLRPYGSKGLTAMPADGFVEYMLSTADIWEMLAFVKLRYVGGNRDLGQATEDETRRIIHETAASLDAEELRLETLRVRRSLEQKRARPGPEIDIKYGAGGMLDVYFAMRYLQLRDNVPDDPDNRSTSFMLDRLFEHGSLSAEDHAELKSGYKLLTTLDHQIRLAIGRTTVVPAGNRPALETIAGRLKFASAKALLEALSLNRMAIRSAYDKVVSE